MTKQKATPELIKRYHKWLIEIAEEKRGRPPPQNCKRCAK